ncbi:hypothetical protein quinque_015458 [Culex quinquefasciatus]
MVCCDWHVWQTINIRPSAMNSISSKLLVLLTFGCSFGSSGRHSDTLDYVVSIVLELAKAERGVPNCVFYDENNASFHDGFLGQVLRDERLEFVTKTVFRRSNFSVEKVTLLAEPMVVIIQEEQGLDMAYKMDLEHAYVFRRDIEPEILPRYYDSANRMYRYKCLDLSLGRYPQILITKTRSPLMDAFAYTLNCLIEGGIYHFWTNTLANLVTKVNNLAEFDLEVLYFSDLAPALLAWLVGNVAGGAIFCIEMLHGKISLEMSALKRM